MGSRVLQEDLLGSFRPAAKAAAPWGLCGLVLALATVLSGCREERVLSGIEFANDGKTFHAATDEPFCGRLTIENLADYPIVLRSAVYLRETGGLSSEERGRRTVLPKDVVTEYFDWAGGDPGDYYVLTAFAATEKEEKDAADWKYTKQIEELTAAKALSDAAYERYTEDQSHKAEIKDYVSAPDENFISQTDYLKDLKDAASAKAVWDAKNSQDLQAAKSAMDAADAKYANDLKDAKGSANLKKGMTLKIRDVIQVKDYGWPFRPCDWVTNPAGLLALNSGAYHERR
jgi:hypothetical protein